MPEAAPPGAEAPRVPAIWKRLVDVFTRPAELFDALRERPLWGGALWLGAFFVVLSLLLIPRDIWSETFEAQLAASGVEAPALAGALGAVLIWAQAVIGGLLGWAVMAFFLAGLAWLVFGFILGDDGRYRQYLSVTCHALLIAAVGALLILPLRIAASNPMLTLSVGTFFPMGKGYLFRFLSGLDLFMIWAYVVLAVGASRIDRGRSVASATVAMLVVLLGLTALFALIPRPA